MARYPQFLEALPPKVCSTKERHSKFVVDVQMPDIHTWHATMHCLVQVVSTAFVPIHVFMRMVDQSILEHPDPQVIMRLAALAVFPVDVAMKEGEAFSMLVL